MPHRDARPALATDNADVLLGMRKAEISPRTIDPVTMPSDSSSPGSVFISRTAANRSTIRRLSETFRMGCCKCLTHSDSFVFSTAQILRIALIRLLVTAPKIPIRISAARATFGQARDHADIRFVRYPPESSRRRPELPAIRGTADQRFSQGCAAVGESRLVAVETLSGHRWAEASARAAAFGLLGVSSLATGHL
jgi:hypothetical protein